MSFTIRHGTAQLRRSRTPAELTLRNNNFWRELRSSLTPFTGPGTTNEPFYSPIQCTVVIGTGCLRWTRVVGPAAQRSGQCAKGWIQGYFWTRLKKSNPRQRRLADQPVQLSCGVAGGALPEARSITCRRTPHPVLSLTLPLAATAMTVTAPVATLLLCTAGVGLWVREREVT